MNIHTQEINKYTCYCYIVYVTYVYDRITLRVSICIGTWDNAPDQSLRAAAHGHCPNQGTATSRGDARRGRGTPPDVRVWGLVEGFGDTSYRTGPTSTRVECCHVLSCVIYRMFKKRRVWAGSPGLLSVPLYQRHCMSLATSSTREAEGTFVSLGRLSMQKVVSMGVFWALPIMFPGAPYQVHSRHEQNHGTTVQL